MLKLINENDNKIFAIGCVGLFIFSMMFPALPHIAIMIFLLLFAVLTVFQKNEMYRDWLFYLVFISSFGIALIDWHASVPDNLKLIIVWPLSFIFGKYIVGNDGVKDERRTSIAAATMAIGLCTQGFINYANHNDGLEASVSWDGWNEIWTGNLMSRTVYSYDFILIAGALFLVFLIYKTNRILASAILGLNIITFVLEVVFAKGRLQFCMQVALTFLMLVIITIKNRNKLSDKTKKTIRIAFVVIIIFMIILFALVSLNVFGLKTMYANSFLSRDGGILRNVRFRSIAEGLVLTIQQPLGGWNTPSLGIAHNVFLLFAKEYDIIIFALLIAFEVLSIIKGLVLISKQNTSYVEYYLFAMLMGFLLYFNIETCPWRYRYYWVCLFVVSGMISQKLSNKKLKEN